MCLVANSLINCFSSIEDFRMKNENFRHNLVDILIISILATICAADGWTEIVRFGRAKEDWLRKFLELPNGIPSHDTFGRVFSLLDPKVFEAYFREWLQTLAVDLKNEIIAVDGKTLRGSGYKKINKPASHLVSAWATRSRLMLGQIKTESKSNEITAIPELLKVLDIKNCIITIDAMGCQTKIAKQILSQEAGYVLNLKANQATLHEDVINIFASAEAEKTKQYKKILHRRRVIKTKNHGRQEKRTFTLVSARDEQGFALRWPGLKGIGKMDVTSTSNNKTMRYTRYFITSLDYTNIDLFIESVRNHWHIEIELHWTLDVSFREDHSQVRIGNAAENLALIRRIALNLLKQEKTHENGINVRRKTAGWDNQYLLKVLKVDLEEKGDKL